jgi:hypothetical protein
VAGELKPLPALLPLAVELVGVLRAGVDIPMLAMFYRWENLALSSSIALQLIGEDDSRHVSQSCEQFAEELFRAVLSRCLSSTAMLSATGGAYNSSM